MKLLVLSLAAAIGLASPAFAHASEAYVTTDVRLMAGPDEDYPVVDNLEPGSEVDIQGCTEDSEWCDVIAYGERGWVPGGALEFEYDNQWVLVPEYAPSYGIPVVSFSIERYWDSYYRHRPFYGRRWDWYRWHPGHRPWSYHPTRPWPIHGPPPVHHPMPPPRVVPLPHPIYGNPPPHVQPLPHPIYGNPPPHVQPRPVVPNQPPRVVPMPHPVPTTPPPRNESPRADSKSSDRDRSER